MGACIVEDSSGNAGASIAAYSARAGIKAKIFVPYKVSGLKINQIKAYGAEVIKVPGNRNNVTKQAQTPEKGKFYVGHILNPLFRDGLRSIAYEIVEQLNWSPPTRIYLPVSAGTLILGVIMGFRHLVDSGEIEKVPKILACQTRQASPLYHLFYNLRYVRLKPVSSVADALVSTNPPLLNLMNKHLKETNGDVVLVDEHEIINTSIELAKKGFFVEPSSAVAYAAYKKHLKNRETSKKCRTVIILTGTGLKTSLQTTVI
jgi:threonine synthase